jgi:hypothetical protein
MTSAAPLSANVRKHHKFGPSRMGYLDECAAFTSKPGTNEAAEEGTFLHDVMEKMLKEVVKGRAKTTLEQMSGWVAKSYELTDDQIAYLRFCCKKLDLFIAKRPTKIHTEIDVRVKHPDGKELNHGFLDVLFEFGKTGILIDFKFGAVPVAHARVNLQMKNYTLGGLQHFKHLERIGVIIIQPKLNSITEHMFARAEAPQIYEQLKGVIDRAEFVQRNPAKAQQFMKPGKYCEYCALSGSCAVLANHRGMAVSKYTGMPLPPSFKGLELTTPEDLALARYWVDIIETGLGEVKQRAREVAEANGGSISCTLPNGEVIVYEMQERSADRSLGDARQVADALKEICTYDEILGAAELAITKLEPIVKNAAVQMAAANGIKLTKKAAWEQAQASLEAQGLLTRPDGKIRFLKFKKQQKQIEG